MRGLAVLGIVLLGLVGVAQADIVPSASFTVTYPNIAVLTVAGESGASFRVLAEQPDGSYQVGATGLIGGGGSSTLALQMRGPVDAAPQFRVAVMTPTGEYWINLSDKEYAFD